MADESRVRANVRTPLKFVGLGEVLFDVFEDGTATLGGAPLNVAVHAHQLASALGVGEGIVVSRVGRDPLGSQISHALTERGMSTRYLQMDPVHSTGTVSVFMLDGEPGYQIESDAAWDFLEHEANLDGLAASCDAVCFGSLAQRGLVSQGAIRCFLQKASGALRLYDMNLRRNTLTHETGYSAEVIEESCHLATTMKLNEIELSELCELYGIACSAGSGEGMIRKRIEGVLT
ncbi:MAG: PfkB family carbohydrate kinase, partial [Bryobacteraceae bacterium]